MGRASGSPDWERAGLSHPYADLATLENFLSLPDDAALALLAAQEGGDGDRRARAPAVPRRARAQPDRLRGDLSEPRPGSHRGRDRVSRADARPRPALSAPGRGHLESEARRRARPSFAQPSSSRAARAAALERTAAVLIDYGIRSAEQGRRARRTFVQIDPPQPGRGRRRRAPSAWSPRTRARPDFVARLGRSSEDRTAHREVGAAAGASLRSCEGRGVPSAWRARGGVAMGAPAARPAASRAAARRCRSTPSAARRRAGESR